MRHNLLLPLAAALAASTPAMAGDTAQTPTPPAARVWSLGIEGSPEFYAIDNGSNNGGALASSYFKLSLSRSFENNFVGGLQFQTTFKTGDKTQFYGEATAGYKWKVTDTFTLTPSLGLGYTWKDTGIIKGTQSDADVAYYAIYLSGDLKLNKQWTWNAFNLRYRNAFNATWETPKVATGVTYNIDSFNSVYANVGYSWKKVGTTKAPYDSLSGDKVNVAIGYKHAF